MNWYVDTRPMQDTGESGQHLSNAEVRQLNLKLGVTPIKSYYPNMNWPNPTHENKEKKQKTKKFRVVWMIQMQGRHFKG